MTLNRLYLFLLMLPLFFCCKEVDLNDLLNRQQEQGEQLQALTELCNKINKDIRDLEVLVNAGKDKNYITSVKELPDNSGYVVSFSKSDPITIRHGNKGPAGDPGKPGNDGQNGSDGTNGSDGEPGKDGESGNQGPDGSSGNKGEQGDPGQSPVVGIIQDPDDNELYWTIQIGSAPVEYLKDSDGNRVKAKSTVADGSTPRLSIEELRGDGGGFYWMQQIGSGPKEWLLVDGEKVKAHAENAVIPSKFESVDYSNPDFVEFTLIDGITKIKVPRGGGSIVFTLTSDFLFFRRNERQTVDFTCTGIDESKLNISTPRGWNATGDPSTGSLSLTAPPITDRLADPDGVVQLSGVSRTGETIEAFLPVTMLYKLQIPDFKGSFVYNLLLAGVKVGEICREYIPAYSTNSQATVIYPYSSGQYATGLILENSGRISHDGVTYTSGNKSPASVSIYTEDGTGYYTEQTRTGTKPDLGDGFKPEFLTDTDKNTYSVVKIGTQYWTSENIRTLTYADGKPIDTNLSGSNWTSSGAGGGGIDGDGACAVYGYPNAKDPAARNDKMTYGVLYNYNAVQKVILPGWKLPRSEDVSVLKNFLSSREAFVLKESGTQHWTSTTPDVSNLTGFTARGGGYRDANGTFAALLNQGYWWTGSSQEDVYSVMMLSATNTELKLVSGENNARGYHIRLLKK